MRGIFYLYVISIFFINESRKEVMIVDYSRKISERLWNTPDKGELESKRELTFIDDIIQKSHIEKTLLDFAVQ